MVGIILLLTQFFVQASELSDTAEYCGRQALNSSIYIRDIKSSEEHYQGPIALKASTVVLVPLVELISFGTQMTRLYVYDPEQMAAEAQFQVIVDELKIQKRKLSGIKDKRERELRTACLVKCFTSNWIEYDFDLIDGINDFDVGSMLTKIKGDFAYRPSNIMLRRKGVCTQFSVAASKLLMRLGVMAPVAIGNGHAFNTMKSAPLYFEPQNEECEFLNHNPTH